MAGKPGKPEVDELITCCLFKDSRCKQQAKLRKSLSHRLHLEVNGRDEERRTKAGVKTPVGETTLKNSLFAERTKDIHQGECQAMKTFVDHGTKKFTLMFTGIVLLDSVNSQMEVIFPFIHCHVIDAKREIVHGDVFARFRRGCN